VVVGGLVGEKQDMLGDRGAENLLGGLGTELLDKRGRVARHEGSHGFLVKRQTNSKIIAEVVERLDDHDSVLSNSKLGTDSSISTQSENVVLVLSGEGSELLRGIRVDTGKHTQSEHLVCFLKLQQVIITADGDKGRSGFLINPRNNLALSSTTIVINSLSVLEVLNGRKSTNLIGLGKLSSLSGINFGEFNG
jgi:hypothetical protein